MSDKVCNAARQKFCPAALWAVKTSPPPMSSARLKHRPGDGAAPSFAAPAKSFAAWIKRSRSSR